MLFWQTNSDLTTDAQRQLYQLEVVDNFRWVGKLGLVSKYPHSLTAADLASPELQQELADLGEFTEVVHSSISPQAVWANLALLSRPDFPLADYRAVPNSTLKSTFRSTSGVQGYVVHRPDLAQLVVAFAGTETVLQALQDIDARRVHYPAHHASGTGTVHAGFWRVYKGLKAPALAALRASFEGRKIREVAVVGHSMGAAIAYLFVLDIFQAEPGGLNSLPLGCALKLAVFGCPRVGDAALVEQFRMLSGRFRAAQGPFTEYSVRAYNDGVPALPPRILGFAHFASSPYYFHHGRLYQVPAAASEFALFDIQSSSADAAPPAHPRGGHNYYNVRNMERLGRRMKWAGAVHGASALPEQWEVAYAVELEREQRKLSQTGGLRNCFCIISGA